MDAQTRIVFQRLALAVILCLATVTAMAHQRSPAGQAVVVEVGEQEITWAELNEYVGNGLYSYVYPVRAEAYEHALTDLVTDELKRIDLFASGLADDSELHGRLARNVTEELGLAYAKRKYEDRYLNEETIRAEHERMGNVVTYRQIVLAKSSNPNGAELDSLRAITEDIQRRLEDGAAFESLERHYNGVFASDASGEPRTVTWQQTVSTPRAFILFRMEPGDVQSFEGPLTFSIVRVERIDRTPAPPLEEVREEIVSALHRWHSEPATRAFRNEWMSLVDTLALEWNSPGLDHVLSWSNTPGFYEGSYRSVIDDYLAAHDDLLVLTDGRGEVRLSDLPRIIAEVLTLESSGNHTRKVIKDYLLEAVRTERLADRARAAGLMAEIWRADTPSPVLARGFVHFYNERFVEDRMPEPTEERLRDFYREFDDSLFYQLERVNTEIIVRSDSAEIAEIWRQLQDGAEFSEVSHRRLIRSFQRTPDGTITTLFNPEPPYLGEVAFGMGEGEIAGPVSYMDQRNGQRFAVIRATRRFEERQLSFDEVRDRVEAEFLDHHRSRLAEEVAERLRQRYPVKVHPDVLERHLAVSP